MSRDEKINIQKMADTLKELSNDIIISGHKNADFDSMCSSLALAYSLRNLKKNAKVFIEKDSITKIAYFNLNDLLCDSFESSNYTFIALDFNRTSRLPNDIEKYYSMADYKINIDHHNGNTTNANQILNLSNVSSTCEIIYEIVKKMNVKIDKKLSELIFTGIISDTNLFSNDVSSRTFSIVSNLLKNNINSDFLIEKFYLEKTKNEMDIIAYINNNLNKYNFHYVVLDMKKEPFNRVSYSDISKKCIPIILTRQDINVLMVMMNYGNKIKGEIRSKNDIDVSKLAELLTGGGHTHAAGFANNKTLNEIITITKRYLNGDYGVEGEY